MTTQRLNRGSFRSLLPMIFFVLSWSHPFASLNAGWSLPVAISSTLSDGPKVAVDLAGNAVAVWQGFDGVNYVIQSSLRPVNGSWSAPTDISTGFMNAQGAIIAVDKAGNAFAAWGCYDGTCSIVQAAELPFGGVWSLPETLSMSGGNANSVVIAADKFGVAGNVSVGWHRFDGSHFILQSASLLAGGIWGASLDVSSPQEDTLVHKLKIDASGTAVLCYCVSNGETYQLYVSKQDLGLDWGTSYLIASGSTSGFQPVMEVNGDGKMVVLWSESQTAGQVVAAVLWDLADPYAEPLSLPSIGENAYNQAIAVSSTGEVVAAWTEFDGSHCPAFTATLAAGVWSIPTQLSSGAEDVSEIELAYDSSGNAIAIWDATDGINSKIQTRTLSTLGSWSSIMDLSTVGKDATSPSIHADLLGGAVAVWLESEGAETIVASSVYTQ